MTEYLFRAFHANSGSRYENGGFVATVHPPVYHRYDTGDLERHFNKNNRVPTNWISTTCCLLRAIKLAVHAALNGEEEVCIAVIEFAACNSNNTPRTAESLALELGAEVKPWHCNEYLIELRIPPAAVVACVSLDDLEYRGIFQLVPQLDPHDPDHYDCLEDYFETSVAGLKNSISEGPETPWEVGTKAARLAECFDFGFHTVFLADLVVDWWGWVDEEEEDEIQRGMRKRIRSWPRYSRPQ